MPRRPPTRTARVVAALDPPPRGRLARAVAGTDFLLAGLGLCAAILVTAELHLDGTAGLAVRAAVAAVLAACLGFAAHRLRAPIDILEAVRRGHDAMGEGVVVLEPATLRVVHASPAASAIFGRELAGLDIRDSLDPTDRALIDERRRLRSAGHRVPPNAAMPIVLPDGRRRFVEWATTPLNADGCALLLSIVRDVTAREQAKRKLDEEHGFTATVLDAAAGPIVVIAADGRVLRVNAAATRLAGVTAGTLVGRTPWELGLMTAGQAAAVVAGLREGRDPYRHVVAVGDRFVSWSATALRDEAAQIHSVVSVGVDVTERRAAEDRARHALAALDIRSHELERANRDLARFVELASHDLRDAVQAVTGFADLLDAQTGRQLDPRAAEHLAATREAAGTIAGLLDGLAAYGRLGRREAAVGDVDCERTLDLVLHELAEEIDARGAAVTRDPLPVVAGDAGELTTLLSQLVTNALRFGGEQVHVGAERRPLGWKLTVRDDGDGMPEDERTRIFDTLRGRGVGLALCRRIAERHGGAIWLEDAGGGGSVFHVTLPDREAR